MTGAEIIQQFLIYYDRITSFSAPGYEQNEILAFLNSAQDEFVKDRTFGKNFQPPAFEDNPKRVADVSPLLSVVSTSTGLSADSKYGNSYKYLRSSFAASRPLYVIKAEAKNTRSGYPSVTDEWMECERIKSENTGKFISSTINKVHFLHPKWIEDDDNIWFIGDTYMSAISEVKITFIKKPYPITATISEYDGTYGATRMSLDSSVHQEIVDIAVRQALQAIQDPRYQSKISEQQIKSE